MKPVQNTSAGYSDYTAWLMCEMSALAYLRWETEEMPTLKKCLKVAGFSLKRTFNEDGTEAFLATRKTDKIAVLAFRGTQKGDGRDKGRRKDIETNMYAEFNTKKSGPKVHSGFINAFNHVKKAVASETKNLDGHSLYITGHSLGGALAIIAARELKYDRIAACYTYGSPMVGNGKFGKKIKVPVYRVVNATDRIPRLLLLKLGGYKHYGDMWYLTACDSDKKNLKVTNVAAVAKKDRRRARRRAIKDHRIKEYRNKLEILRDKSESSLNT